MALLYKGSKLFVSPVPANSDLTLAQFTALTDWVEIDCPISIGERGASEEIASQSCLTTGVMQKQKGVIDAGAPEIVVAYNATDAGQILLNTMSLTNQNYAFKLELNDAPTTGASPKPTTEYWRGMVTLPVRAAAEVEAFYNLTFTVALNQIVIVAPASAT